LSTGQSWRSLDELKWGYRGTDYYYGLSFDKPSFNIRARGEPGFKQVDEMELVLVNPPHRRGGAIYPAGRAYIASTLRARGHGVRVLDLAINQPADTELERLLGNLGDWDALLTGGLITTYRSVKKIIRLAKRLRPERPVVVGDGLVSGDPEFAITHLEADFGVVGEGEATIVELLQAIEAKDDPAKVDGLIFRENGGVRTTPPRKHLSPEALDALPLPSLDDWDLEYYTRPYGIYNAENLREFHLVAQRGCSFNCHFCYNVFGHSSRARSAESIVDELEFLHEKHDVRLMHMGTDLYLAHKPLVRRVAEESRRRGFEMRWVANGRVDMIDDEYADFLVSAGCHAILFGFESFHDGQLEAMGKKATCEQIARTVESCRRAGLFVYGSLMIYLGETLETIQTTMDRARELDVIPHRMFIVNPYPKTKLFEQIRHRIVDLEAYYDSLGDAFNMVINPTDFDDGLLVRMRDRIYQEMRRDYLNRHPPEELPFRKEAKRGFVTLGPEFGRNAREIHDRILQERSLSARSVNLKDMMSRLKSFGANIKRGILEKLPASVSKVALAGRNELAAQIIGSLESEGIEVASVHDNNAELHGKRVCGVEIRPFEELKATRPDAVIIASLSYAFQSSSRLKRS